MKKKKDTSLTENRTYHKHAKSNLRINVARRTPILLENTERNLAELLGERRRKFAVAAGILLPCRDRAACVDQSLKFFLDTSVLGALAPGLEPVEIRLRTRRGADDLEHPLGGVGVLRALEPAVALKVGNHRLGVLTDLAKVDCLTALLEEEEPVEALEEHGRGLMDRTEDGLAALGELFEEIKNSPGSLGVKTGSGLVDEEQQRRLSSKFDTDSKTLSLFDVQTFAGNTDDSIGILFHVEQLDDLVDVGELLFARDMSGLAEESAKVERFADGSGLEVEILLLDVTGLALERGITGVAVDKHGTGNDTHGNSIGQAVEQSRLTRTGNTHQRRQGTRLNPTVNMIQNPAILLLDLDIVAHVLPVEDRGLLLQMTGKSGIGIAGGDRTDLGHHSLRIIRLLLLQRGGLVATAENENLALGLLLRDEFGGNHVRRQEEEDETDEDTEISPPMRPSILEPRL